ncbi:MAG TPA: GIY-YIG nuclease family protein [Agriterribacter sp.]|nr:GIY-YIG nuclease family protein [Agriterribacter sp.]
MIYTVYVLYSATAGKHYTGYTSDLPNRLLSHNRFVKTQQPRIAPPFIFHPSLIFNTHNAAKDLL